MSSRDAFEFRVARVSEHDVIRCPDCFTNGFTVVLLGVFAVAAGAAHRTVAAMSRAIREPPHAEVAVTLTVMEISRTRRGVRDMITVLRVVSRAYEICIPFHHAESQIFDVTDSKKLRCRFPPIFPFASADWPLSPLPNSPGAPVAGGVGGLDDHTKAGDRRGR